MVTSCRWQQMKVITPAGDDSKVIYVFSQSGKQQLEQAGASLTTTLSTNASRFEFVTIQEVLQAQHVDEQDDEPVAQWLQCEAEVIAAAERLPEPFQLANQKRKTAAAVPFAVYYFANWREDDGPIIALPISLFSGQVAPDLMRLMRSFPLTVKGLPAVVSPNVSLNGAYAIAARCLEQALTDEETGRAGLVWCDTVQQQERHRRRLHVGSGTDKWDHLQVEGGTRRILGVQPIEYLSLAVIMVPFVLLAWHNPVQDCGFGILDPVIGNIHLTQKELGI